jgi:hypothetical protein
LDSIEDGALVDDFLISAVSELLDYRPEFRLIMLSSLVEMSPYGQCFNRQSSNALRTASFGILLSFFSEGLPSFAKQLIALLQSYYAFI